MQRQSDLFIRSDAELIIKDAPALAAIDALLPDVVYLKPYQICEVLPIGEDVIYKWIKAFKFNYLDLSAGKSVARYAVERKSFLAFLATLVNRIR